MSDISVFKRHEIKYLISRQQKEELLRTIADYMKIDQYGMTTIRSLYCDTPDHYLIRKSLEHPEYKEKLRIRSYGKAGADDKIFVEIKKKYDHVVYKRRISMSLRSAQLWLASPQACEMDSQIGEEIEYFRNFYNGLAPRALIMYDREAYFMKDGSDFRLTFDENIIGRDYDLDLGSEVYGTRLIEDGMVLMELKISSAMPMWMANALSRKKIFQTSFSKYGTLYENVIFPESMAAGKNRIYRKKYVLAGNGRNASCSNIVNGGSIYV